MLLYGWGVGFNAMALAFKDREAIAANGLLQVTPHTSYYTSMSYTFHVFPTSYTSYVCRMTCRSSTCPHRVVSHPEQR